ncbi:MAG: heme-binding protein [Armatimonadetes bacterium]|nr:heme-binding protein [Armatimonadota bacterium]
MDRALDGDVECLRTRFEGGSVLHERTRQAIGTLGVGLGIVVLSVALNAPRPSTARTPAGGVRMEHNISLALAAEAAGGAVEACAQRNYFVVVAAVVDRAGQLKALLRGDNATPHTIHSVRRKAYKSATPRNNTLAIQNNVQTNPAAAQLASIDGILALGGGVPIRVGEGVIGAIGVGAAPGGNLDEECANAGIARIRARLN